MLSIRGPVEAVFVICVTMLYLAEGASIYVDQSVPSSGNGSSWETAFKTIQEGIGAAAPGDEVVVAEGTYVETVDFKGKAITVRSKDPGDPGVVASTVIEFGVSSEVVRFRSREGKSSVIAGFTIASGEVGVSCIWSSPVIRDNIILANTAWFDQGGGISCYYSSPLIENNIISSNRAYLGGGGIACEGAQPVIVGNLIIENRTDTDGAAIMCIDCFPTIARNRIIKNTAEDGNGGGIFCIGSRPRILNNLIVSNVANSTGGGIGCYSSVPMIIGNTIADNASQGGGAGGIDLLDSPGLILNCILWGNGADISGGTASFCCLEDDDPDHQGEGNIHDDPVFEDRDGTDNLLGTQDDDYRLSEGSPCLDKGSFARMVELSIWREGPALSLSWDPGTDLSGHGRIMRAGPDIGCYEYPGEAPSYVLESSSDLHLWSSLNQGPDPSFLLTVTPPEQVMFFRVGLGQN